MSDIAGVPSRPAHGDRAGVAALTTPALAMLAALIVRLGVGPLTIDDAFITFRYARNLAEGAGLVYNPGEAVLGTTTPLYAVLMAAFYRVGLIDLPTVSWVLNAGADALSVLLLFMLGRRLIGPLAGGIAAALFAFSPMSVAFSAGGMEGSVFVLLLLTSFWLVLNGRNRLAIFLIGLATLVRPEAVMAAGLVLAGQLVFTRRVPLVGQLTRLLPFRLVGLWRHHRGFRAAITTSDVLGTALIYLATIVPWALLATWQYGSPIPQSMTAKAIVYATAYRAEPWINAIALATQAGAPAQSLFLLHAYADRMGEVIAAVLIGLPLVLGLLAIGARRLVATDRRAWPWVLFPLAYATAYAVAGFRGVRMFHWYVVPLLPFYALLLGAGAAAAVGNLTFTRVRWLRWTPIVLLALWWAPGLVSQTAAGYPSGFTNDRERLYRAVAATYHEQWTAATTLALPEIGALGYYSRAQVLDTVGLVSPVAVRYYPIPGNPLLADNTVPPALIQDLQPDYVVSLDQFVRGTLSADPWFLRNYIVVERRAIDLWERKELIVYRRLGLSPDPRG